MPLVIDRTRRLSMRVGRVYSEWMVQMKNNRHKWNVGGDRHINNQLTVDLFNCRIAVFLRHHRALKTIIYATHKRCWKVFSGFSFSAGGWNSLACCFSLLWKSSWTVKFHYYAIRWRLKHKRRSSVEMMRMPRLIECVLLIQLTSRFTAADAATAQKS